MEKKKRVQEKRIEGDEGRKNTATRWRNVL